jgi:exonuclease III
VSFTLSLTGIAGGASDFPTVRSQNKGWRIDYINVTDPLKNKLKDAEIYPACKTF